MPRGPRLDAPGTLHHVITRGIERCTIFADDADRSDLLQRIARVLTATQSACYAWCLIPNHLHLLWRSGQAPLSRCLQRALGGSAGSFNRRHHRSGHLFQNRVKSTIVQDNLCLLELVRYIHLNPLRAHLVADVAALDTDAWTGHATLLGQPACSGQDPAAVLEQFGPTVAMARRADRAFVVAGLSAAPVDLDGGGLRRTPLGAAAVPTLPRGRERWTFDEPILGTTAFVSGVSTQPAPTGSP